MSTRQNAWKYHLPGTENRAAMLLTLTERSTMLRKAYAVRDAKAGLYDKPFYQHTHGEAERSFAQGCKDEKSNLSQFPEDYDLYYLGIYDDEKGLFQSLDTPQHIIKAVDTLNR